MSEIVDLSALEILDSRGNPTVAVTATLATGASGTAKIPSGASTGKREAIELRDGDRSRYAGKGVRQACANVRGEIRNALRGMDAADQSNVDSNLIELDGTPNKSRLGANALLGASLAVARAAAADARRPLYAHLARSRDFVLPTPMLNLLNGGRHADNSVDFQEFMVAPVGSPTFSEGLRAGVEVFHTLKSLLQKRGLSTAVGDEGGFAPQLESNEQALQLLLEAIVRSGYKPGDEIAIMLDPAASEFFENGSYVFRKSNSGRRSPVEMISMWSEWVQKYPEIWSLEDGMSEEDTGGWKALTQTLGSKLQLVGDDNFVTNPEIFKAGIKEEVANAILIKLNQIGTLTETLYCISLAQEHGYGAVISHRSGETDDTTIADLAVATGVGQIKTGSASRGERIAKYNRLLEIESELGSRAVYAGKRPYLRWRGSVSKKPRGAKK